MSLLRSISMSPLHKRRQRRSRLGTLCCEGGADGMDLREVEGDGEEGKGNELIREKILVSFFSFLVFSPCVTFIYIYTMLFYRRTYGV